MKDPKIYSTQDLDIATFLIFEGIKFIDCDVIDGVVFLNFDDAKRSCLDLERTFLNSEFKRFRSIHRYLLKQVHQALRDAKK